MRPKANRRLRGRQASGKPAKMLTPRKPGIRIAMWGNCMAVRIPKAQAHETGLTVGSEVVLEKTAQGVLIKPARRRPTLKELVARISAENLHGEIDTGAPVGREIF